MNQHAFPTARRVPLQGGGWLTVHEQMGQGPTLILLHGLTDCADSFALIAPHLAGRHLIMPDLRGHGASFRADSMGLADMAQDIQDIAQGLTDTVLIGHSMGALLALTLAAALKARGLILISGSLQPAGPALTRIAGQFAALPQPLPTDHPFLDEWYACTTPMPPRFVTRMRAACIAMRPQDRAGALAALTQADLRPLAQNLTIPTLTISGDLDPIFPPTHSATLRQYLRPAKHLALPTLGHNPHWEAPVQIAAAIQAFVATLP